jgi:malate dehydrogenase (oxaloacetate-decarboxylating)(NADP+)
MSNADAALEYHYRDPAGKFETAITKPANTQRDLSLAYSPGVAAPCRAIDGDADEAYTYTGKGNLVGVVSNGSATLGFGNVGAQAAKPVLEGIGVLFKRFADIDVFDIELAHDDPEAFVQSVATMEPTFGAINLEDIAPPECFEIEQALRERLSIPVFHNNQHGTAITSGAALLNATDIVEKDIEDLTVAFAGAGASAIGTARFYCSLGVRKENILMCDSEGLLTEERAEADDINRFKQEFARDVPAGDLATAMEGADVFVGLAVRNLVTPEMVRSMAANPIVFPMATPEPEIGYEAAKEARDDTTVVATGRSDYPNQVNNALSFPFVLRGALDARASEITDQMEVTAAKVLAQLARENVPDTVRDAYSNQTLQFGPEYILPKLLDPRVLTEVAPAVTKAAVDTGVARTDVEPTQHAERLEARLGRSRELMRVIRNKAKSDPKRIVLAEADTEPMVHAAYRLHNQGLAEPVLIGERAWIEDCIEGLGRNIEFTPDIIDPAEADLSEYATRLYQLRQRNGMTRREAADLVENSNYLGSVMVERGEADGLLTGLEHNYPTVLRPPLRVIGTGPDAEYVSGVYLLTFQDRVVFCADTTVNQEPDEAVLEAVTKHTATLARRFNIEPRAALLSYSDFGSVDTDGTRKPREAVRMLQNDPTVDFAVDGEMQADTAVVEDILHETYEFSALDEPANVLVFPNLEAGNISYKLLQRLGGGTAIGPMLVGMDEPVHVLQRGDDVRDIVNLASVAVVDAQQTD